MQLWVLIAYTFLWRIENLEAEKLSQNKYVKLRPIAELWQEMKRRLRASSGSQLELHWHTRDTLHSPDHFTNAPSLLGGLFKLQNFPSLPLACALHKHRLLLLQPHYHPSIRLQALSGYIFNHHSPISHVNISAGSDQVRAQTLNSNYVLLCNKHLWQCELSDWNALKRIALFIWLKQNNQKHIFCLICSWTFMDIWTKSLCCVLVFSKESMLNCMKKSMWIDTDNFVSMRKGKLTLQCTLLHMTYCLFNY